MRTLRMLLAVVGVSLLTWVVAGCGSKEGGEAVTASITGSTPAESAARADEKHPRVLVHTSLGDFTCELDAEAAPMTVENFLGYVARGHYDKTLFHQVEHGFIALAGGYDVEMQEKPTDAPVRNEAHNGAKNLRGTIAMARESDVVDGARAQFFLNLVDNPDLDFRNREVDGYGYCVFGKVVDGLDVVERIGAVPVRDTDQFVKLPTDKVVIESIKRVK